MIRVYNVEPSPQGFGEYLRSTDFSKFELDSVEDYISLVLDECCEVQPVRDSPEADAADGHIWNQDGGTVIAWMYPDGEVYLELAIIE